MAEGILYPGTMYGGKDYHVISSLKFSEGYLKNIIMCEDPAFEKECKKYLIRLRKFFVLKMRELKNKRDYAILPDDLVQITIERTLKKWRKGNLRDRYNIKTLLFIKADNVWMDYLAKKKNKVDEDLKQVSNIIPTTDLLHRYSLLNEVNTELKKMPPTIAEIMRLSNQGYKQEEISKILGIAVHTIKMMLYRYRGRNGK